jgi:hypothetical protein
MTTPRSPFGQRPPAPTAATSQDDAPIASAPTEIPTVVQNVPSGEPPTPTAAPAPTAQPTATPLPTPAVVVVPQAPATATSEEIWRAQELNREVLQPMRLYEARVATSLHWFDPLTGQVLEIGTVRGIVPAQALFVFRPTNAAAIEVPYRINNDFGLVSISDALVARMHQAGYSESVEAFVLLSDTVIPAQ